MITDDLERTVGFYEQITGVSAVRHNPVFAELKMPSCNLAFGQTETARLFGGAAKPAANQSLIVEFLVDDVDAEYERLRPLVEDWVLEPTTMPWGNRSMLLRDPDGNLVNFFAPLTAEAAERFSR